MNDKAGFGSKHLLSQHLGDKDRQISVKLRAPWSTYWAAGQTGLQSKTSSHPPPQQQQKKQQRHSSDWRAGSVVSTHSINVRIWAQFPKTNVKLGAVGTSTIPVLLCQDNRWINLGNSPARKPGLWGREQEILSQTSWKARTNTQDLSSDPTNTYLHSHTWAHTKRHTLKKQRGEDGLNPTDSFFLTTLHFFLTLNLILAWPTSTVQFIIFLFDYFSS